jgi:hypothetical protein
LCDHNKTRMSAWLCSSPSYWRNHARSINDVAAKEKKALISSRAFQEGRQIISSEHIFGIRRLQLWFGRLDQGTEIICQIWQKWLWRQHKVCARADVCLRQHVETGVLLSSVPIFQGPCFGCHRTVVHTSAYVRNPLQRG